MTKVQRLKSQLAKFFHEAIYVKIRRIRVKTFVFIRAHLCSSC